jgi:hypothetical protein
LLRSAQLILDNGNPNVILCERGIRTFETAMRNTFDVAAIALLKQISHLPVIADPSHAAGHRELVPALARIAVARARMGCWSRCIPILTRRGAMANSRWILRIRRDDGWAGTVAGTARAGTGAARGGDAGTSLWRPWDEGPAARVLAIAASIVLLIPVCGFGPDAAQSAGCLRHGADIIVTAAPVYVPLAALKGGERFPKGAQLLLIHAGKAEPLVTGFAAAADANVSFDGKTVLFAGKQDAGDPWQIWELTLEDRSVRKLIAGEGDAIRRSICRRGGWFMRGARRRDFGWRLRAKTAWIACADRCEGRRDGASAELYAGQRDSDGCAAGWAHSV